MHALYLDIVRHKHPIIVNASTMIAIDHGKMGGVRPPAPVENRQIVKILRQWQFVDFIAGFLAFSAPDYNGRYP